MKYIDYNEKKKHGTDEFPIEYYFVNEDYFQYVMPLHWHLEFEIILVTSGNLELYLNNVKYRLGCGDIAFLECGTLHRATPENAVYECLVFNAGMLKGKKNTVTDKYISPILNNAVRIKSICPADDTELSSTVAALFETMRTRESYHELEMYGLLYRLFSLLYKRGCISKTESDHRNMHRNKIISELLDWIDLHYSEPITLCDLAEFSGLSEKYLCRVFKNYTSRSPIEYINNLRINNVCRDLEFTDCPITEAAFNNGFNNLSYFSKTFKKYKGESPREYVKKHLGYREA